VFDGPKPPVANSGVPIRVRPADLASRLSETELVADIWIADAR